MTDSFDASAAEDEAMQTYDSHDEQFAFVAGAKWHSTRTSPQRGAQDGVEQLIELCSMRPKPGTDAGLAWEAGCHQGYAWGKQALTHPSPQEPKRPCPITLDSLKSHQEIFELGREYEREHPTAPAGALTEWLPIETAPKDGSQIILGGYVHGEWMAMNDDWYQDRVMGDWREWGTIHEEPPTHWTHQPEPPLTTAMSKKGV